MAKERFVLVCLVPPALEDALLEPLVEHYRSDPRVRVVVDRRLGDRRGDAVREKRLSPARRGDRRRGADRRRPALPRTVPALPQELAIHAGELRYAQRLLPVGSALGGATLPEVIEAVRAGDPEAPTELYWRSFERVHSELRRRIPLPDLTDAAVVPAFGRLLDGIESADGGVADRYDDLLVEAVVAAAPAWQSSAGDDSEGEVDAGRSLAVTDPGLDEPAIVTERDPRWFGRGRAEREVLLDVGDVVAVEHIGGTAVPAVPARPIVDLLVAVRSLPVPEPLAETLAERGYIACGDGGTPGRAYFRRRGHAAYDVHVVEQDSELWTEPIALREHLRNHHSAAQRLAVAKTRAAQRSPWSAHRYARARAAALAEALAAMRAAC